MASTSTKESNPELFSLGRPLDAKKMKIKAKKRLAKTSKKKDRHGKSD